MLNFAILAPVDPIQAYTMLWPMETPGIQVCVGAHWTPIGSHTERNVPSLGQHGDIPFGILSFSAHCCGMPKQPFWDPNFKPPMWSVGGPISPCP